VTLADWDRALVGRLLFSPLLAQAAWTTAWVAVVAQTIGTVLGFVFGPMQLMRSPFPRIVAGVYSWIFRGTPLLVQILFFYAVLPQLGFRLGVLESGLVALGVNEGARMAEIVRSGIISVDSGQSEAARSLGMSSLQAFRLVVLPQALRVIIPPLGNNFNYMLKATSLLAVISVAELLRSSQQIAQSTTRPLEVYSVAGLYYLLMTTVWSIIQHFLEQRGRVGGARDSGPTNAPVGQKLASAGA
jgi:polar amino acid transport system permease protein